MISFFAFYKPLFMFQLLIAEFLFCRRLRRRSRFWLRYLLAAAACFVFSIVLVFTPDNAFELSLIFIALFAITLVSNIFCYDESVVLPYKRVCIATFFLLPF